MFTVSEIWLIQMEKTCVFVLLVYFVYFNKTIISSYFSTYIFFDKEKLSMVKYKCGYYSNEQWKAFIYKQAEIQNPHITLENANSWNCDLLQWLAYLFCNQLKLWYTYTEAHKHTYTHTLIQMYTLVWMILNIVVFIVINYECKWVSIH